MLIISCFHTGAVELENLPLKKDALRQIGIPVEIKSGFIGKVKLQVPVSQFRSAPWIICIEQLYVVTGPVSMAQVILTSPLLHTDAYICTLKITYSKF